MADKESKPPRVAMQCFVWGIYMLGVAIILLAIDEVGIFTGDRVLTWSMWRWLTVLMAVIVLGIGIGLALQYWVDNWCLRWEASIKKKAAKKMRKIEVKERVKREIDNDPP